MEKTASDPGASTVQPTRTERLTDLHEKIDAMFAYAYNYGFSVDKDIANLYFSNSELDASQLTEIYNHLT